ncbi:helix-turn-helix domain-containing protein [Amycolatopsis aidingensis]|uniref:helix-turn-helix domain-containing protein n=1 Tax=Amycolatopsis aidingensis TaxID=2842453 RepID=UPI001C0D227B|nr:helix-turn-helix transcriptional regulator [Amycolatopsis aidingensis]
MYDDGNDVGRRLREIRSWRQLSLQVTADLSGISYGYLAKIERGEKPVTKRRTLEALAAALRVSPVELTGKPYTPVAKDDAETFAQMTALGDMLIGWWVGEVPDTPARPWETVLVDFDRLNNELRPGSDYAAQAAMLPGLVRELLVYAADPQRKTDALVALVQAYHAAGALAARLGFAGLPTVAVERMRSAAELLGDPVWVAASAWSRAHLLSSTSRPRQYQLAVRVADSAPVERPETRGMANLTAALAAASQGDADSARTHLDEAAAVAEQLEPDVSPWPPSMMNFGRTNVGIWKTSIGVELGEGAKVARYARGLRLESISTSRQAGFWADYGRGLLAERKTREEGLGAILHAERLAPQQIRSNTFVREAVFGLLGSARRDAGGRELRGLAWRMGVVPNG